MMAAETMLGLFKTAKGVGNLEIRELSIPKPEPNEALIEVKMAGLCGTDVHIRHDRFPYWPPVILGHEFSGVIVETGNQVTGYRIGDRVVGEPHTKACGKCELCRSGNIQLCSMKRSPGWGIHGAFTRYIAMPEHLLHRIPDTMTFEEGAVVEPAANVIQDVLERGRVDPNDFVVINGSGPIGLLAIQAVRAAGAGTVVLVGTASGEMTRLPLARELGADATVVAERQDPVEFVMDMSRGRGADLVVEASGSPRAVAASVRMVRRLGRITAIGLTGREELSFPWDVAMWKVCTITFNLSTGYSCWDRTIGMIAAKKLNVGRIVSHLLPLREWERAFDEVESRRALKALLIPE